MEHLSKTFLYHKHLSLNANMTEFGGFAMPLYYSSISDEHELIRNAVGVFDVSHMGLILVKGTDTHKFLNYVLTSNINSGNKITYALMLNEDGNILDDLMVYPFKDHEMMLVVNASNTKKDLLHLEKYATNFDVTITTLNDRYGCLAVQGPKSNDLITKLITNIPKHSSEYLISQEASNNIIISRSGYTGEDGFEIYGTHQYLSTLFDTLITEGVKPAGLGCRDTLRFEAGMPLYGNEMSEEINPLEAGLKFAVSGDKDFIGKDKLPEKPTRRIVALELLEKNIARNGYLVYNNDLEIGFITTGYLSITTKKPLALAMINSDYTKIGTEVLIKIRNKMVKAIVRNKKFIEKNNNI